MALTTYNLTTPSSTGATIAITEDFDISISGTFVGSVILQRSYDSGTTWSVVSTFICETEGAVRVTRSSSYRAITGPNFSGTAKIIVANNV